MRRRLHRYASLAILSGMVAGVLLAAQPRAEAAPSSAVHTDMAAFEAGSTDGGFQVRKAGNGELALAPTLADLSLWAELSGTPLPQKRFQHTAVALGRHMFVIGGGDETSTPQATVYHNVQQANGDLGSWQPEASLPQTLMEHAAVSTGQTILVIGGKTSLGTGHTATIYRARLNPEGGLAPWQALDSTPLPQPLANHAAAVVHGSLFVIGGRNASSLRQQTVYRAGLRADGALTDWIETTPLPAPLSGHKLATVNNCLFVVGGENASGHLSSVYAAQVQPDGNIAAWQDLAQGRLPVPLQQHVLWATHGRLILAGGYNRIEDPSPVSDRVYWATVEPGCTLSAWQALPDAALPRPLGAAAGVTMDGHLYLLGGHSITGLHFDTVYRAELIPAGPFPGPWQTLNTTLPEATSGAAAAMTAGRLYVVGGERQAGPLNQVYSAALQGGGGLDRWRPETSLPLPLAHHVLLGLGDRLLLLGGHDGGADTSAVYQATIGPDGTLSDWRAHPCPLPAAISYHTALVVGDGIFVGGGRTGFAETSAVYRLRRDDDGSQGCWQPVSPLPLPLAAHAMAAAAGYLFVSGGITQSGGSYRDGLYRATINPDGSLTNWIELSTTPLPRRLWGHGMLTQQGHLYVLGGRNPTPSSAQHQVYRAAIQPNGDLGAWQELPGNALPQGIYDHAIANDDLYLFVIGGLRNGQPQAEVHSATLYQGVAYATYTHQFDLGSDQDIGELRVKARGDPGAALSVRFRLAPGETAEYGPWSEALITSTVSIYEKGRYLQYQLAVANPNGGVKAIDEVGLTYGDIGDYVKAIDERGAGIPGAEVYLNGRRAGTTDARGVLPPNVLPALRSGDQLAVLHQITQTDTLRQAHTTPDGEGNWAYRTYITNLDVTGAGATVPYTVTNRGGQVIGVQRDNPLILFNLVVSIEWDAEITYTQQISQAVRNASDYLYDVSDGQMAFGHVAIYDNSNHWPDADIQISTNNIVRPHAYVGGITAQDTSHVIRLGRGWNRAGDEQGRWDAPDGFRTLTHEFSHYALFLYDEYFVYDFGPNGELNGELPASCTGPENQNPLTFASNASIMDSQYDASEFAMRDIAGLWSSACQATAQWQLAGQEVQAHESDWETIARKYGDAGSSPRWTIATPASRAGLMAGPDSLPSALPAWPEVQTFSGDPAAPNRLLTVNHPNGGGYWGAIVALYKLDGRVIGQGFTNSNGQLAIFGAAEGDVLRVASFDGGLSGRSIVGPDTNISLQLTPARATTAQAAGGIPYMRVIANPDPPSSQINLQVGLYNFGVGAAPRVSATAPGSEGYAPLALSYSPVSGVYEGKLSFSASARGMGRILTDAELPSGRLLRLQSTYRLQHLVNTQSREVFSNDGNLALHIEAGGLSGNDAYLVVMPPGQVPEALPEGLVLVGEAYDVTASGAQVDFEKAALLTLHYGGALTNQDATPEGLGIYRWAPGLGWQALGGTLDAEHHAMTAPISKLGIYALLAPPGAWNAPPKIFLPLVRAKSP